MHGTNIAVRAEPPWPSKMHGTGPPPNEVRFTHRSLAGRVHTWAWPTNAPSRTNSSAKTAELKARILAPAPQIATCSTCFDESTSLVTQRERPPGFQASNHGTSARPAVWRCVLAFARWCVCLDSWPFFAPAARGLPRPPPHGSMRAGRLPLSTPRGLQSSALTLHWCTQ